MNLLRALFRLLGLMGVQAAFAALAFVLYQRYRNDRAAGMARAVHYTGIWGRACCRWLQIKIRIQGSPPPEGGALVVANHIGSPDIFVLAATLPGFFVAKQEVKAWPLVGRMADIGGTVYIDRDKRQSARTLLEGMRERLSSGYRVIVFPEGRATDGSSLHPFKTPPFEAAIRSHCPVLPVVIRYHDGHRPSLASWQDQTFGRHLWRLLRISQLEVTVHLLPTVPSKGKRRELARLVYSQMESEYHRIMEMASAKRDSAD